MLKPWNIRGRKSGELPGTVIFVLIVVAFCVYELKFESVKMLWFDEIATLITSSQPTLRQMFLAEIPDPHPPLLYLLSRCSLALFGTGAMALRLPEFVMMLVALFSCFLFVARRFGTGAGSLAAALLVNSPIAPYAVEARPYALIAGFLGVVLVFWQRAAESGESRRGSMVGLSLGLFALTISNVFGVVWGLLPLAAGESVRFVRARSLDRAMLCAIVAGLTGLFVAAPFALSTRALLLRQAGHLTAQIAAPTTERFIDNIRILFIGLPLKLVIPLGVAAMVSCLLVRFGKQAPEKIPATTHEFAAIGALCCAPFVIWAMTFAATHYFFDRYTYAACVGISIAPAMLCGLLPGRNVVLPALALSLLWLYTTEMKSSIASAKMVFWSSADDALLSKGDPDEPIVVASAVNFLQVWRYSGQPTRQRLHFVEDTAKVLKTADFIPELYLSAQNEKHALPFALDEGNVFLRQHRRFLLLYTDDPLYGGEWLPNDLRARKYTFAVYDKRFAGMQLAEVKAPGDAD